MATRGRKPKPTAMKELEGNPGKHPLNTSEPEPNIETHTNHSHCIKLSSTPHHPHPEEHIWAGRTPRVPDAPKIKHDKMKQFCMIDMERKRW